ncbi:MAG: hypothetical protein QG604_431, partial [Candidatus Dependentiae bacterium]|nr:hypothetical protein [Candidatus Dependentiae bacterium]
SPPGVLFTFPSRYLFTIGHQVVFSLIPWSGQIPAEFHVLRGTWENINYVFYRFAYKAVTFYGCPFQSYSTTIKTTSCASILAHSYFPQPSYNNAYQLTLHKFLALPISLTTTKGITFVFFSSHYLDVSVHAVNFCLLYIHKQTLDQQSSRLPHSEIPGSKLIWQLPKAFGSLTPLSSSPDTKASSRYPLQLYAISYNSQSSTTQTYTLTFVRWYLSLQ